MKIAIILHRGEELFIFYEKELGGREPRKTMDTTTENQAPENQATFQIIFDFSKKVLLNNLETC